MLRRGKIVVFIADIFILVPILLIASWGLSKVLWGGAQAGTAAKSAFLDAGVPVEVTSLAVEDMLVSDAMFLPIRPEYLSVACGAGEIRISFKTGEAEFINCDPSDASKSLWTGLKPFFNDCRR